MILIGGDNIGSDPSGHGLQVTCRHSDRKDSTEMTLSWLLVLHLVLLTLAVLFGPFFWSLTFPLSHEVSRPPPASPHTPPSLLLTQHQKETFREEGVLVLRDVMPPHLMEDLGRASDDIVANR